MPSRVYVIELEPKAGKRRDPRIPWVYVGSSARDPEIRFEQHRRGYKSSGLVRRFALHLRPDLYDDLEPFQGSGAARHAELARAEGARRMRLRRALRRRLLRARGRLLGGVGLAPACPRRRARRRRRAGAARVGVRAARRPHLRPVASRRARVLGRRVPRSGGSAARLRPLLARRHRRARASTRAHARRDLGRRPVLRTSMRRCLPALAAVVALLVAVPASAAPVPTERVPGIDVSRFQEDINWSKVALDGVQFAFVQASRGSGHDCTVKPDAVRGRRLLRRQLRRGQGLRHPRRALSPRLRGRQTVRPGSRPTPARRPASSPPRSATSAAPTCAPSSTWRRPSRI